MATMAQISHSASPANRRRTISSLENTICRYEEHNNLLRTYKNNRSVPKGLKLKFNLSLCENDHRLKKEISKILNKSSSQIQESLIKANDRHIFNTNNRKNNFINSLPEDSITELLAGVHANTTLLRHKLQQNHASKFSRDNIDPTKTIKKGKTRNRRFDKKKRNSRKRNNRLSKKSANLIRKQIAIDNTPDQNAINLSDSLLSEEAKSLLKKGP